MTLEIQEEHTKNTLNMGITIYRVVLDGFTIAECRDPYWANYLANAIKTEKDAK